MCTEGISILFVLSHDTISQPLSRFIVSMFGMQEHRMQFIWELLSQDVPNKIYHSISQLLPQCPNSLAIKTFLTVMIKTEVASEKLIPVILTNQTSAKKLLLCSLWVHWAEDFACRSCYLHILKFTQCRNVLFLWFAS